MEKRLGAAQMYQGRSLTPEERQSLEWGLEDGEQLNHAAGVSLTPRIRELEWELPATTAMQQLNGRLERRLASRRAREAREEVFGDPEPPFGTLQEAHDWLKGQRADDWDYCERRHHEDMQLHWDTILRLHAILSRLHKDWTVPVRLVDGVLDSTEHHIALPAVTGQQGMGGVPQEAFNLSTWPPADTVPGEVHYLAPTPKLRQLAAAARELANIVRVWTRGQAMLYILTDSTPTPARVRLWQVELPVDNMSDEEYHVWHDLMETAPRDDETRARFESHPSPLPRLQHLIELNGTPNWREWQEIYRMLRAASGLKGKKSFTPEDVELVEFMEYFLEHGKLRPEHNAANTLAAWNRNYPDRSYSSYQALRNAYRRAVDRRNRP